MKRSAPWLLLAVLCGCAQEVATPGPDAGLDAGTLDADAGNTTAVDAGPRFGPLAPSSQLVPEPVAVWQLGVVSEAVRQQAGGEDPVLMHLRNTTFTCPEVGIDADGVRWRPVIVPESGQLEPPNSAGSGVLYLVACIVSPQVRGLVAQVDGFNSIFVNGAEQPGDVYRSGRYRLPAPLVVGDNLVVLRGSTDTQRGLPIVRLWQTEHELSLNLDDQTFPDLVVGDREPQYLGVPVLNLREQPVIEVWAAVEEDEHFEATARAHVSLPGGAVTQLGFELRLKDALTITATTAPLKVRLLVQAADLEWSYGAEVELKVVPEATAYRASFISHMDGSVQYFGVAPPPSVDPSRAYATILSLHGAGVQGIGQARAYGLKDWAYIVAATNRRPFGFDWEDWGRLDGLEVLQEAQRRFVSDPTQVYLTGHSMGGHGSWNVGVTHPGRFALVGPSAGWSHFDAYGGARSPAPGPGIAGAFAAAQQHSQTLDFLGNLSRRAVYIIHGDADDNVPVSFARNMRAALEGICEDLHYHEEPGAGHWWDGYPEPGAQCVDWPEMMDLMRQRRLDPYELDFTFKTAGPWVSPQHSFVTLESALDPYTSLSVTSSQAGSRVQLSTRNVRSLQLDAAALTAKNITEVQVDGERRSVAQGDLHFGPTEGKRPGQHGPVKEAFFRPWIWVYDEAGPDAYRALAAYFTTYWSFIGNGHNAALPLSALTEAQRAGHNIIYLGIDSARFKEAGRAPVQVSGAEIIVGGDRYQDSATVFVFPEGEGLSAAFYATPGSEDLLYGLVPFRSGFGLPDYMVYARGGTRTAGFVHGDWSVDPELRR